jgi:hypothetical protein
MVDWVDVLIKHWSVPYAMQSDRYTVGPESDLEGCEKCETKE